MTQVADFWLASSEISNISECNLENMQKNSGCIQFKNKNELKYSFCWTLRVFFSFTLVQDVLYRIYLKGANLDV